MKITKNPITINQLIEKLKSIENDGFGQLIVQSNDKPIIGLCAYRAFPAMALQYGETNGLTVSELLNLLYKCLSGEYELYGHKYGEYKPILNSFVYVAVDDENCSYQIVYNTHRDFDYENHYVEISTITMKEKPSLYDISLSEPFPKKNNIK